MSGFLTLQLWHREKVIGESINMHIKLFPEDYKGLLFATSILVFIIPFCHVMLWNFLYLMSVFEELIFKSGRKVKERQIELGSFWYYPISTLCYFWSGGNHGSFFFSLKYNFTICVKYWYWLFQTLLSHWWPPKQTKKRNKIKFSYTSFYRNILTFKMPNFLYK